MGERKSESGGPSIVLEGEGWKRRSGFGKYSDSIGGSSWERRRFALTSSAKLIYYKTSEPTPRGTTDVLYERATFSVTHPGDASQPTPYGLAIKTCDTMGVESLKWKFCFEDQETQLLWLVALTGIVADASVKEFNSMVLSTESDKSVHGGFHRLYEEGDGRLLDLVHTALLSRKGMDDKKKEDGQGEGVEVVPADTDARKIRLLSARSQRSLTSKMASSLTRAPSSMASSLTRAPSAEAGFNLDGAGNTGDKASVERLYQAAALFAACLVYEKCAENASSLLWKIASIVILGICFAPPAKSRDGEKEGKSTQPSSFGSDSKEGGNSSPKKLVTIKDGEVNKSSAEQPELTNSTVGTELLKAEGVPLSGTPSIRIPAGEKTPDRRTEPLTEDEMKAHRHERWAVSAPGVDLSGEWTLIADDAFKLEYDAYLKRLGFSGITRKVACSLIGRTSEVTRQSDNGRELYLKGTNPKGAWERTLVASGYPDFQTPSDGEEGEGHAHVKTSIKTADSEDVDAEAWWEEGGAKHISWLRGGKKYGGGDFESLRYLEDGSSGNVLVCESIFHPRDASKEKASVTWRFQRDSAKE